VGFPPGNFSKIVGSLALASVLVVEGVRVFLLRSEGGEKYWQRQVGEAEIQLSDSPGQALAAATAAIMDLHPRATFSDVGPSGILAIVPWDRESPSGVIFSVVALEAAGGSLAEVRTAPAYFPWLSSYQRSAGREVEELLQLLGPSVE
jgi:hypothetical protein